MFTTTCRREICRAGLGLCVAFTITMLGMGDAAASFQSEPMDPSMRVLRGELVMIRPTEILVKGNEGPDRVLKIATATMVIRNGKAATIKELKNGDQVEVVLGVKDVARSIKVTAEKK